MQNNKYYHKYSKYKNKYLGLKNNNIIIIHISGAPGSGKTTLGKKILQHFDDKITVVDFDDLFMQYISENEFNSKGYQKYLDDFINNNKKKIIIFVGLNKDMGRTDKLYDINPMYKYYIDIHINTLLERLFNREISNIYKHRKYIFRDWLNDPIRTTEKMKNNVDLNKMKAETIIFNKLYESMDYEFLSQNLILKKIKDIIHSI